MSEAETGLGMFSMFGRTGSPQKGAPQTREYRDTAFRPVDFISSVYVIVCVVFLK